MVPRKIENDCLGCLEPPQMTQYSKKLIAILTSCQAEDVSVTKTVQDLRKIYLPIKEDAMARENFFQNKVFILQAILSNGSTNKKLSEFDKKIMQACSRFAASFASESKGPENSETSTSTSEQEIPWITSRFINWLLDCSGVTSSCARLRICLLINWLLKHLGDNYEMNSDLYDKIFDSMLERLEDKVPEIRAQAVTALHRLQDPLDPNCPIIKAYLFHLACDPSAAVRRTVIKSIGASRYTLGFVLRKAKDIDDTVRAASFTFLTEKIHMKSLTIASREVVLKSGLNDRSRAVQKIVKNELLPTWVNQYDGCLLKFLYGLDVGCSDGVTAADCLKAIFSSLPLSSLIENFTIVDGKTRLIPLHLLSPESVVYWKNLVEFLIKAETDGNEIATTLLEKIRPELTSFIEYIGDFFSDYCSDGGQDECVQMEVKKDFIGKNLIEMTELFDFSDENGRRTLIRLFLKLLSSRHIGINFTKPLMKMYHAAQFESAIRIKEIVEIIADLREPLLSTQKPNFVLTQQETVSTQDKANAEMEQEEELRTKRVELAKQRVRINEMTDEMNKASEVQDFQLALKLKLELETLIKEHKTLHDDVLKAKDITLKEECEPMPETQTQAKCEDPIVILKCLTLIAELLRSPEIRKLTPSLQALLEEFVVPSAANVSNQIRQAAVRAIGSLCLLDEQSTTRHITLILQMIKLDVPEVRIQAIQEVINLLMYHGSTPYNSVSDQGDDLSDENHFENLDTHAKVKKGGVDFVVSAICELLESENMEIQTQAVEGLCKLLLRGLIGSPKLLSRFIMLWFNPVSDNNSKLAHILGAFLPLYPSLSYDNQLALIESFPLTMETISDVPASSPLSKINPEEVGKFYIDVTSMGFLQDKTSGMNAHDTFAIQLFVVCLKNPDHIFVKHHVKFISNLQITPSDERGLLDLKDLNDQLIEARDEKNIQKYLKEMREKLDAMLRALNVNISQPDTTASKTSSTDDPSSEIDSNRASKRASRKRTLFSQRNNMLETSEQEIALTLTEISDQDERFSIVTTSSSSQISPKKGSSLTVIPETDLDTTSSHKTSETDHLSVDSQEPKQTRSSRLSKQDGPSTSKTSMKRQTSTRLKRTLTSDGDKSKLKKSRKKIVATIDSSFAEENSDDSDFEEKRPSRSMRSSNSKRSSTRKVPAKAPAQAASSGPSAVKRSRRMA